MAVYFDHRIDGPGSRDVPTRLTWHSALPLLAVASSSSSTGGNVDLYLQQVSARLNTHGHWKAAWIIPTSVFTTQCIM